MAMISIFYSVNIVRAISYVYKHHVIYTHSGVTAVIGLESCLCVY